jgi:hypothetical protein
MRRGFLFSCARTASNCALPPFKAVSTYYAADARTRERKVASWVPHLQRSPKRLTPKPSPAIPTWMGEVAAFAHVLTHTGMLKTIQEQVRFARARFGKSRSHRFCRSTDRLRPFRRTDEASLLRTVDSLGGCLHGSDRGETACPIARPCPDFWQPSTRTRWKPCAPVFKRMGLRALPFLPPSGLFDRTGVRWLVIDVDGTRQTARQRALPQTDVLPAPHRRFEAVCAPGYQGRKRGEVVRTRTVILQAHTQQFLGTDCADLAMGITAVTCGGHPGDHELCCQARASSHLHPPAVGWSVWRCRAPSRCALSGSGGGREKSGKRICWIWTW